MTSKVVAIMSMSLDGHVADANDGVAEVFDWYISGDVEVLTASGTSGMTFRVSAPSADHLRGLQAEVGAMLTGRRTFERADGWGGRHPWIPAFVATHHVPDGWPRPGSTVQFVTDGIESAVARAKSAAGPKPVGVHGARTIQQCLDAGLLDEIHIDLAAVLLGAGVRLFDHLANRIMRFLLASADIKNASTGSAVMAPSIGEDFVVWKPPVSGDETLGIVDFAMFPRTSLGTLRPAECGALLGPVVSARERRTRPDRRSDRRGRDCIPGAA
jgi:dihydrofolate reductase